MARRGGVNRRPSRRGGRRGRRNVRGGGMVRVARLLARSNPPSTLRNAARLGIASHAVMRSFQCYPRLPSSTAQPQDSWLDKLVRYGSLAMKLFAFVVGEESPYNAVSAIVGSTQTILVGPEDLLYGNAIQEVEAFQVRQDVTELVPILDYKQARISMLSIRVTPGAELARRGGRVAIAVVPLTAQEVEWYRPTNAFGSNWRTKDSVPFDTIVQLPGATIAPASAPMTVTWRPKTTDYGFRFLQMGVPDAPSLAEASQASRGGDPVVKIFIGYRDFASSKPDPTTTYAPEEAMIHLDIRGHVQLTENRRVYIRPYPPRVSDTSSVALASARTSARFMYSVPLEHCRLHDNGMGVVFPVEHVTATDRRAPAIRVPPPSSGLSSIERLSIISQSETLLPL